MSEKKLETSEFTAISHRVRSGVVKISTKRPKNCLKNVPVIEKL